MGVRHSYNLLKFHSIFLSVDVRKENQMTDDQPKPPLKHGGKLSRKFRALMDGTDHTKLGHIALGYTFLSPIFAFLIYFIASMIGNIPGTFKLIGIPIGIILLALPVGVCFFLGIQSIRYGIKEHRAWLIVEGIVTILVGSPLSLLWVYLALICG